MEYRLRFFIKQNKADDEFCFVTVHSEHLPKLKEVVYFSDDLLKRSPNAKSLFSKSYRVVKKTTTFDFPETSGDEYCSSIEITVEELD